MADKRAYFKLDVGYLTNPKVADVALESASAVLLHIGSIGYAAQHLTDGEVPLALLLRLTGATKKDAQLLLDAGLWEVGSDAGKVTVHDYLSHQRSSAEVKGASEAAKRAAQARWDADGNADGNAERMPNAEQPASETAMPREIGEKEIGRTRKRALPADFRPTDSHVQLAASEGVDLRAEWPQFVDHHNSRGTTMKDWDAALRTWIRNAKKFGGAKAALAVVTDPENLPARERSWMERR